MSLVVVVLLCTYHPSGCTTYDGVNIGFAVRDAQRNGSDSYTTQQITNMTYPVTAIATTTG